MVIITGDNKGNTLYVPGLRVSTNPVKGLNVQGELAWQFGDQVVVTHARTYQQEAERRDAMAAQILANYSLPVLEKYKPAVNASSPMFPVIRTARKTTAMMLLNLPRFTALGPYVSAQGGGIFTTPFSYPTCISLSLGFQLILCRMSPLRYME